MYSEYFIVLFKIILAIFLSGVIGMERQQKNRPAGFRTHIMVCLGSMTIMILSEFLFDKYYNLYGITSDPSRMSAQVISGIGFLGAGTIIHYGTNVKGLTTAATLWVVAAIGLTVGAGYYFLAFSVAVSIYFILFIFSRITKMVHESGNVLELNLDIINRPKTMGEISMTIAEFNGKILDMEFSQDPDEEFVSMNEVKKVMSLHIIIQFQADTKQREVINRLGEIKGILNVVKI